MSQNVVKSQFIELGRFLSQFTSKEYQKNDTVKNNSAFYDDFATLIENSIHHNNWFTKENVLFSVENWASALTEEKINSWLQPYDFSNVEKKNVGIILAGNIPLVGFHDFLSVLISGHRVLVKLSSNDQQLIQFLAKYLIELNPYFEENIVFVEGKLENFDAIIATGSNNTSRYFEYYFGKVPNIIRKNRNSTAVLNGHETKEQLVALGEDIFRYFGLGCRNVSKLFVPKNYNFDAFFEAMFTYQDIVQYEKYANNYDYNKAVYLMSLYKILDNGFLTIKEDSNYASPISSVFYEYYENLEEVSQRIKTDKDQIQCIVSDNLVENSIAFGQTQKPNLWDYADDLDTIKFLLSLR
jgi:hypothetical protein